MALALHLATSGTNSSETRTAQPHQGAQGDGSGGNFCQYVPIYFPAGGHAKITSLILGLKQTGLKLSTVSLSLLFAI